QIAAEECEGVLQRRSVSGRILPPVQKPDERKVLNEMPEKHARRGVGSVRCPGEGVKQRHTRPEKHRLGPSYRHPDTRSMEDSVNVHAGGNDRREESGIKDERRK